MTKRIVIIVLISIFITGCDPKRDRVKMGDLRFTLPNADIAFQSIEAPEGKVDGEDVLGFYSITDETKNILDFNLNLISPDYIDSDTLISINKQGYPGMIIDYGGYVFIIKGDHYIECRTASAFGVGIQPYHNNILLNLANQINLISSKDCSLLKVIISKDDLSEFGSKVRITSYSLSANGDFIILSLYTPSKLFFINKNLSNKSYFIYNNIGGFPSISPDQTKVAYLATNGIHIMAPDGENDELVVPYETSNIGSSTFDRGNQPKPKWSKDGLKLIYHKCDQESITSCENIVDYNIYEFDLNTRTEILLIQNGINPTYKP